MDYQKLFPERLLFSSSWYLYHSSIQCQLFVYLLGFNFFKCLLWIKTTLSLEMAWHRTFFFLMWSRWCILLSPKTIPPCFWISVFGESLTSQSFPGTRIPDWKGEVSQSVFSNRFVFWLLPVTDLQSSSWQGHNGAAGGPAGLFCTEPLEGQDPGLSTWNKALQQSLANFRPHRRKVGRKEPGRYCLVS